MISIMRQSKHINSNISHSDFYSSSKHFILIIITRFDSSSFRFNLVPITAHSNLYLLNTPLVS